MMWYLCSLGNDFTPNVLWQLLCSMIDARFWSSSPHKRGKATIGALARKSTILGEQILIPFIFPFNSGGNQPHPLKIKHSVCMYAHAHSTARTYMHSQSWSNTHMCTVSPSLAIVFEPSLNLFYLPSLSFSTPQASFP